jgi:hypothetical protein
MAYTLLMIILPILISYLLTTLAWRDREAARSAFWLRVILSVGMGLGLASCIYFAAMILSGTMPGGFWNFEFFLYVGVLPLLLIIHLRLGENRHNENGVAVTGAISEYVPRFLLATFFVILLMSVGYFIFRCISQPHGAYDAWSIWNLKARFFFRGNENWPVAFTATSGIGHPDYPLLLPISVARIWTFLGVDSIMVPGIIAFLFTFATIGLLVTSVAILRGLNLGLLAGLCLMGVAFFVRNGTWLAADIPLCFYMLATIVLFAIKDSRSRQLTGLAALAGVSAGLAAWTKNEGLLFILIVVFVRFLVYLREKKLKIYFKEIGAFGLGLLPVLTTVLWFKIFYAPPSYLWSDRDSMSIIAPLMDWQRYVVIGRAYISEFFDLFKLRILILPLLIFSLGFTEIVPAQKRSRTSIVFIIIAMLGGYFLVYLCTPRDLVWHLNTSMKRLYLQLLPIALFYLFLILSTPEKILHKKGTATALSRSDPDYIIQGQFRTTPTPERYD